MIHPRSRYWVALPILLAATVQAAEAPKVRLNTVGYLPGASKRATIAAPCGRFSVVRVDAKAPDFEGAATGPVRNADTAEALFTADFSAVREPGTYRLVVPGVGESPPFRVAADLYRDPFALATRAMYLWRCGTAVSATIGGETFAHDPCHLDDAWLDVVAGRHEKAASVGGWHDAGDYNKYVTNAGVTVGVMLRAWDDFRPAIRGVSLGLPEAGGPLPEYLAEIKYETDWLLTMQAPDGSAYAKVSTKGFGGFVAPEREKTDRFFAPWGSAATADLVAMLAQASRAFRPYDPAYADRCLAAARKGYAFLVAHPADHPADQRQFKTGGYESGDDDDRLWAAAEVWETTGDPAALRDLEARIAAVAGTVEAAWDWGNVRDLGLLAYVSSGRDGRDPSLVGRVRSSLVATADGIVATAASHGYARPLGSAYSWGGNGTVARQAVLLHAASRVKADPAYRAAILDGLNHLLGRNVDGRSYVTGLGDKPPMFPHDRRSGSDKVVAPWPGYLVGGPHPKPIDWKDDQGDYRTNEIAINWNAALIYALASVLETGGK